MALSDKAKQALDDVLAAIAAENHTIFGVLVNSDSTELQPFGNCGDNPQAWLHNMETSAAAVRETLNNKHEA